MRFDYQSLHGLIDGLRDNGYRIATYHDCQEQGRCVILRHDVDYDPAKAIELARREAEWDVRSTYFFLLTSPLYNALSTEVGTMMCEIVRLGHEVGLHFDETRYPDAVGDCSAMIDAINREARILSTVLGSGVRSVSMHRPSRWTLDSDLAIPGMVNSYGAKFFHGFKYVSDSRRRWREPIEEIVASGTYNRLHILTHAFWYAEEERDINSAVSTFVNRGSMDRYSAFAENITDIGSIMAQDEVTREI